MRVIKGIYIDSDLDEFIRKKFKRGEFNNWLNEELKLVFKLPTEKKEERFHLRQ